MQRRKFLGAAGALASASTLGLASSFSSVANAEGTHKLRVGTLAPRGSAWMRVFNAWNNSLKKKTDGRLQLQFYSGGAAGDERDMVRKMRAGQLDAAVITTTGLGQIVRSVLVLQAPGVCYTYPRIDAVRAQLGTEFQNQFDSAGFKLLGWGDAGQGRVFSGKRIVTPDDMKTTRMWAWRDDPTWQAVLDAAGVNGVQLGLNEVFTALNSSRIDAFPATSIAAVAFQWYTKAEFVTKEPRGIVVGATVIKKEKFDALPGDLKAAMLDTSKDAHKALQRVIRDDDRKSFDEIVKRGVKPISLAGSSKTWDDIMKTARQKLVGKLYSADLLARVERIAASAG